MEEPVEWRRLIDRCKERDARINNILGRLLPNGWGITVPSPTPECSPDLGSGADARLRSQLAAAREQLRQKDAEIAALRSRAAAAQGARGTPAPAQAEDAEVEDDEGLERKFEQELGALRARLASLSSTGRKTFL
eukprot:m51a1_g11298 hypothetical protein (135) ;mRNA; f:63677-64081